MYPGYAQGDANAAERLSFDSELKQGDPSLSQLQCLCMTLNCMLEWNFFVNKGMKWFYMMHFQNCLVKYDRLQQEQMVIEGFFFGILTTLFAIHKCFTVDYFSFLMK